MFFHFAPPTSPNALICNDIAMRCSTLPSPHRCTAALPQAYMR